MVGHHHLLTGLSLTAGMAIMLYTVAPGLSIHAINGLKSVRLQGN